MASDTRERLLDAAADAIARHGYAGAAVQDVLAASGAAPSSLYHHFPGGKADLAAAAMTRIGDGTRALIDQILAEGTKAAVDAMFLTGARQLEAEDFAAGCRVATPLADGSDEPEVRAAAAAVFASWESALSRALRREGWPARRAREVAVAAIALYEGALLMARAERSVRPMDAARRSLHALLTTGP